MKKKTVAASSAAVRGVCRNVELDKYTHIKQTQTFTLDAHTSARPTVRAKTHGPLSCFRKGLCGGVWGYERGSRDSQRIQHVDACIAVFPIHIYSKSK